MITLIFDILGYILVTFCIIWGLITLYCIMRVIHEIIQDLWSIYG